MARVEYSTVKMKRSNVPGKVPTDPSTVDYGELLVNYAEGKEFVATKNSKNKFVKFEAHPDASGVTFNGEHGDAGFTGKTVEASIQQIEGEMIKNEKITTASLNDLNNKVTSIPEARVTGVATDDKVLSLTNKLVATTISLDYGNATSTALTGKKTIKLIGKNNTVISEIDASEFVKDGMLESAELVTDPENQQKGTYIKLVWNADSGKEPIYINVNKLIDTYTNGLGLKLENKQFSVDTDTIATKKYVGSSIDQTKSVIGNYTVNGKKISTSPNLSGSDIAVENHRDTVFTGKTVGDSIVQIEEVILDDEQAIAASLSDLDGRINELNEVKYTGEVNVDATSGTPSGNVTIVNNNASKKFTFTFSGIKGEKGDTGPRGNKGETGATGQPGKDGEPGAAAGFGTPTSSISSDTTGTPRVDVSATGENTAKVFDFKFYNIKGDKGDAATITGATTATTTLDSGSNATASVELTGTKFERGFTFNFGIPKGKDGTTLPENTINTINTLVGYSISEGSGNILCGGDSLNAIKKSTASIDGNGNITGLGTVSAKGFYETSDENLKWFTGEIPVDFEQLKTIPKEYFIWRNRETPINIGTSAQKVQKVYPELVMESEGHLSVDYAKLSIVALKAIDILNERIEKLEEEIKELKK